MTSDVEKILEADHAQLDRLLERAFRAIDSADCRESYLALDYFWARLAMHIRAEHLRLFPIIRAIAKRAADANNHANSNDISELLDNLRHDHDFFMTELARAIKALRLVFSFGNEQETLSTVRGLIDEVRNKLVAHNEVEENLVYPLIAAEYLSVEAMTDLKLLVKKELSNLPQRFRQSPATS